MNWKRLLLAVMATSIVKAQTEPCPAADIPSESADSNFNWYQNQGSWAWVSTIDDVEIRSDGNIHYNGLAPPDNSKRGTHFIHTVCIQWEEGGYNCTGRPGGTVCSLPTVNGIENCWGFA
jgi:hypothetical protein